jgi:dUTP pyrophosphatase
MKISLIRSVKKPTRGTEKSAGLDFYIPYEYENISLIPGQSVIIKSGVKAQIPKDHVFIAFNKSGIATKKYLQVGACVIDEDYQGEIHIHLTNIGRDTIYLSPGEKIVQFILLPVYYTDIEVVDINELYKTKTNRGEGWAGSTGN